MAPVRLARHLLQRRSFETRIHKRHFSRTPRYLVNPLLNLAHFSAAKEAQFLSKHTRIPREEFHPHLQLIRSSEVDPFAPVPGASPSVVSALKKAKTGQSDVQTTYTLAISNMMSQLELSRREAVATTQSLVRMQEKYRRDERSAFWMLLASLGVLSVVFLETNAFGELKEKGKSMVRDWRWMGNPPSHVKPRREKSVAEQRVQKSVIQAIKTSSVVEADPVAISESITAPTPAISKPGWRWSSLFWSSASAA